MQEMKFNMLVIEKNISSVYSSTLSDLSTTHEHQPILQRKNYNPRIDISSLF